MFNRKLKKKIASLEESIDYRNKHDHESGEHLKKGPFIPEYLGFVETVHKTGVTTHARIYTKDGYNMSKAVNTNRNEWIILDPTGMSNSVLLENMYNAIVVLRACGMQMTVFDYHQENKKMLKQIDEDIQKRFEEAKKLEED